MIKKESALPLFPASGPCGNPANRDAGQRKIFAGCYVTAPYVIGRQSKAQLCNDSAARTCWLLPLARPFASALDSTRTMTF